MLILQTLEKIFYKENNVKTILYSCTYNISNSSSDNNIISFLLLTYLSSQEEKQRLMSKKSFIQYSPNSAKNFTEPYCKRQHPDVLIICFSLDK